MHIRYYFEAGCYILGYNITALMGEIIVKGRSMGKVLLYRGKDYDILWDASTPELEEWAFGQLFKNLDELGAYDEVKEDPLYLKARGGDAEARKRFLNMRKSYDEYWALEHVRHPEAQ